MPELDRFYRDNKQKTGLLIVAAWDTAEDVQAVLGEGSALPVLIESTDDIVAAYGVEGVPTAFFIDSQGGIGDVRAGGMTAAEMAAAVAALQ